MLVLPTVGKFKISNNTFHQPSFIDTGRLYVMYNVLVNHIHFMCREDYLPVLMKTVFCLMPEPVVHCYELPQKRVQELFGKLPNLVDGMLFVFVN